jgi:hypothetical protein
MPPSSPPPCAKAKPAANTAVSNNRTNIRSPFPQRAGRNSHPRFATSHLNRLPID